MIEDEPSESWGIRGPGTPNYYAKEIAKKDDAEETKE
jgi:hypothetical protein